MFKRIWRAIDHGEEFFVVFEAAEGYPIYLTRFEKIGDGWKFKWTEHLDLAHRFDSESSALGMFNLLLGFYDVMVLAHCKHNGNNVESVIIKTSNL